MSEEVGSSIKRVLCARLMMYRVARPGIQWFWKRLPLLLPTAREGNVFRGVCHSVHNLPHDCSVTAHPCYGSVGTHPTELLSGL